MKYNSEYHDPWAWSLSIKGATNKEIAQSFGVAERTIIRWQYQYGTDGKPMVDEQGNKVLTSFGMAVENGKSGADARVEQSLFNRAIGYTYTEEESLVEMDKEGNAKPLKMRRIKKHVAADTMAMMYWLNNRSRKSGDWTQSQNGFNGGQSTVDDGFIAALKSTGNEVFANDDSIDEPADLDI